MKSKGLIKSKFKEERKMNYWKITTGFLIICIILLCIILNIQNREYDFGTFKIKEKQLNDISKVVESPFILCEFDSKSCVKISKLDKDGS